MESCSEMENSKEYYTNELQNYLRQLKLDAIRKERVNLKKDIGKVNILKGLCSKGANLDYLEEERGFFCIPNVFWSQRLIKFFIERGRDVNSQDQNGNTALHLALRYDCLGKIKDAIPVSQMNLIKFLLDQNADPNVVNLKGNTALFTLAICYIGLERIEDSILEIAEMLLHKGAKIDIRNNNGESLLHLSTIYNSTRIADWFIQKFDGDIDLRTTDSRTPLMIAAGRSSLDCCQLLIRRGADVNAKDLQGYTALHHAIMAFNSDDNKMCLELLVDSGADLNAKTGSGKNAYEFAIHCYREFTYGAAPIKHAEILEMLSARNIMVLCSPRLSIGTYIALMELDKVMDVYKTYDLKPSDELLANYAFLKLKENENNQKELHGAAMKTVARLSSDDISRFWNLVAFTPKSITSMESDIVSPYVFETLNFLSSEFKRVKDFASSEKTDLNSLQYLAYFFEKWFIMLIESGQKNKAREGIAHFHSIVSLAIACLEKLIQSLNKNMTVFCSRELHYSSFIKALVLIRTSLGEIIPEETVKHNERLLRDLIKLYLVCNNGEPSSDLYNIFETDIELMDIVLDSGILGYKEKNKMALRPFQDYENFEFPLTEKRLKYVLRIVEGGAHVDARNGEDEPTIKEILEKNVQNSSFPYDSLQCMCARVLVRSLVPFKNRVPKRIVNFILQH